MQAPTTDLVRARRDAPTLSGEGTTLTGHFAVFNEWTKIDSSFEGRFLERIAPGAFAKTFAENRDAVKVLFNHGNDTMGDQILGAIDTVEEDERGARYDVDLFDGLPPLILAGLRAGAYGASFRFRVIPGKDDWNDHPERSDTNPDGLPERTVREVQLFEFGPVTFPAYASATAGVRSVSLTDSWMRSRGIPVPEKSLRDFGLAIAHDLATLTGEPASTTDQEPPRHSGLTFGERASVLRELTLRSI